MKDAHPKEHVESMQLYLFALCTWALQSGSYPNYDVYMSRLIWVQSGSKSGSPILVTSKISIWIYNPLMSYPNCKCSKMAKKVDNGWIWRWSCFWSYEAKKAFSANCKVQCCSIVIIGRFVARERQQRPILPSDSGRQMQFVFSGLS